MSHHGHHHAQEHSHGDPAYIQLLRSHIHRENTVLFPMAEGRMSGEERAQLAEAFERFEAEETGAGVHEKAVRLLEELVLAG